MLNDEFELRMENNFEVDLVYMWVNGNDPAWRAKRDAVIGKPQRNSQVNSEGRFFDNDELKYSLRSAELYAPWIRKIFIVTDNQVPEWLDTSNPKVQIIDHKDILPHEALPSFNSSFIEHFLCDIPGLSEHFLLSNDDMFFNRPVGKEVFFDANDGLPIVRLIRRPFHRIARFISEKILKKQQGNYKQIVNTSASWVNKHYGRYFNGKPHHNIDSYLKSDIVRIRELISEEIKAMYPNHKREANDMHRSLYSYAIVAEGRGHLEYTNRKKCFRLALHDTRRYAQLDSLRPAPILFCMNDTQKSTDDDRRIAAAYMQKRFPEKSSFEK